MIWWLFSALCGPLQNVSPRARRGRPIVLTFLCCFLSAAVGNLGVACLPFIITPNHHPHALLLGRRERIVHDLGASHGDRRWTRCSGAVRLLEEFSHWLLRRT